jgi:glycosyltransferase involved in cell wall biosynthesis
MNTLLNDDALSAEMGKTARNRYEKLFSGPALGRAYANLFREIADLA